MTHPQATIRLATPGDLDWAIDQAGREGWNPGLHDAAALTRLAGFTVGLDGVVQQQENYRRAGFVWQYANLRFAFANPGFPRAPSNPFLPAAQVPFADLLALDTACFGFPRPRFLRAWLDLPNAFALAASHGLTKVFETARMYLGPVPALPLNRIFGVTTFELG